MANKLTYPSTIGKMNSRILIETLALAGDGQGGMAETWTTFASVWAKIEPVKAWERLFSAQIQYQRSHKITIRHLAGLTSTMRIKFDNRIFQIKGVRVPEEKPFFMVVDAEEHQGT